MVIFATGAWLGWIANTARIQREAVASIRRDYGSVWYDWEFQNGRFTASGWLWATRWLVNLVGVDAFGHVKSADVVAGPGTSDEGLDQIGRLGRLESLGAVRK